MSFQQRMAAAWHAFDGSILLLLSERDYTAREFDESTASQPEWNGAYKRPRLTVCRLSNAGHTLSDAPSREAADLRLVQWLTEVSG